MLLQHSRWDARVDHEMLVLLPDQDRTRWCMDEIAEALTLLTPLAQRAPSSPYLLQALIAAEHSIALRAADTDWQRIADWYEELEALTGSPIVDLNRAVAVAEAEGPTAGLRLLQDLDLPGRRLPAVRAELLSRAGHLTEAAAYGLALTTCPNEAERTHLLQHRAALTGY